MKKIYILLVWYQIILKNNNKENVITIVIF